MASMDDASYQRNINSALWSAVEENRDACEEWVALITSLVDQDEDDAGWNIEETEEAGESRGMKRAAAAQQRSFRFIDGSLDRQATKKAMQKTRRFERKRFDRKRQVGRAGKVGQLNEPTEQFPAVQTLMEQTERGWGRQWSWSRTPKGAVETGMTAEGRRERWAEHNRCLQDMVTDNGDGSFRLGWISRTEQEQVNARCRSRIGWWQQPWSRLYTPEDTEEKDCNWTREVVGNQSAAFWSGWGEKAARWDEMRAAVAAVQVILQREQAATDKADVRASLHHRHNVALVAANVALAARLAESNNTWPGPTFGTIVGVDGQNWGVVIKKEHGWDGGTVWRLHPSGRIAKESTRGAKWVWADGCTATE